MATAVTSAVPVDNANFCTTLMSVTLNTRTVPSEYPAAANTTLLLLLLLLVPPSDATNSRIVTAVHDARVTSNWISCCSENAPVPVPAPVPPPPPPPTDDEEEEEEEEEEEALGLDAAHMRMLPSAPPAEHTSPGRCGVAGMLCRARTPAAWLDVSRTSEPADHSTNHSVPRTYK
jgi:hypothetical protein